jgi:predicted ATPase
MLLDDAKLVAADGGYRLVGEVERSAVPETLQALIAAASMASDTADRRLVQDAAVLGQTFTLEGLAILSGEAAEGLEPRLRVLVRKELFVLNPSAIAGAGQYGFVQSLIREVAYAALARKERLPDTWPRRAISRPSDRTSWPG